VAPASADFLARLAHGLASDLLTTLCLATDVPITVAPAMNRLMWANSATRANLALLAARGIEVFGPAEGDQACGETGPGRMVEPDVLAVAIMDRPATKGSLAGRKVIVTAGPTRECIDPVRFITNRSSGKMGFAVAEAARNAGAEVILVSGPVSVCTPRGVRRVDVESADEMLAAVNENLTGTDIFIAAAAVSDYRPVQVSTEKIKKTSDSLMLALNRTTDILATIAGRDPRPFVVGFAAETQNVERNALAKLEGKNLDMIAANQVGDGLAFDQDDNALTVYWRGGRRELKRAGKPRLAAELIALIAERYATRASARGPSAVRPEALRRADPA
jgi:phosphopantothenoylcysteine decarboxylase/phosphopantothenate--cysteine ligase